MIVLSSSSASSLSETPSLLSVLKALPADCVRNNLVSAFGRLTDANCNRARPPIGSHQWLPGQWTPVLYGISREWRTYARCVLTHTLTVDLAITVSLQRPGVGNGLSALESFLSNFPSLQHLTLLAGNGGAPVDDGAKPPNSPAYGNSSSLLSMAEAVSVALAAQQLLRLDRPEPSAASASAASQGPRLTSLELRLHPAVWRTLRGADPDDFLQRLAAAHPSLEGLTLHVAVPAPPGASVASSPAPAGASMSGGPPVVVSVAALAGLPELQRLHLGGPIVVEGLAALTQLKGLTLEGIVPPSAHRALPFLTGLTSLRVSDSHQRPYAANPSATPALRNAGGAGASFSASASPSSALVLHQLRRDPTVSALRLRVLHLPDVRLSPKEWASLSRLAPTLLELELATVVTRGSRPDANSRNNSGGELQGMETRPTGGSLATAAAAIAAAMPDWFVRATVGDEAAYSGGGSGGARSTNSGSGGGGGAAAQRRQASSSVTEVEHNRLLAVVGGGSGRRIASATAAGTPKGGGAAAAVNGGGRGGPAPSSLSSASSCPLLPGLRRLVLWDYHEAGQLVELLRLLPDLQELHAGLLLDDPPNCPAAALRPAAVAMLRPLVEALRPLRDVRLTVSCDPAAVTGQLACVFLMESGLAAVAGIRGLSLNVWVAAEVQLGSLAALAQLRSLELTLGKQEQESELSVLTRLERLSYLSLRITPGIWNEIQGRTGRVTAGAALRLAMSFAAGQVLLLVADVHREICEDEAISLVKSVEMTTGQPGAAWAVSAWVEETAEYIMGFGPSAG
ncbi:hypothetical protein Agub_g14588, partial [Astrephomene gubernaculifera]